ncbi:MAG: hypothetical protein ACKVZ0_17260 [Gemmatimonadales bacterium]
MDQAWVGSLLTLAVVLAPRLESQTHPAVREAQAAYDSLSFGRAIRAGQRAVKERLTPADQLRAWQLLGFAYASVDSTRQAREAFKQAVFLDPDLALDESRVSPKITSLYALALREVLVVRTPTVDSTEFVVGRGAVGIRVSVTRTARVELRIAGPNGSAIIDSARGEGSMGFRWDGRLANGVVPAAGIYTVVVEATSGRDSYARSVKLRVTPGAVDTATHLASLPGYDLLPETVVPPRSWRPFGLSLLTSAVAGGAALALESGRLGGGPHRELAGVSVAAIGIGFLSILRKPAAVPSEPNLRYNRIVLDNLARENGRIAIENERRRQQVRLSVVPVAPALTGGEP